MFEIPDEKMFMDAVHGYIRIPKCFVKHLIDTKAFQRLRNIDQTGMRILFPSAKHDRYGHSLGVYHLGYKAVDALLENFKQDAYWHISSDNKSAIFWAKTKLLFLIACLLHDIGHAPFSHALEDVVLEASRDEEGSFSKRLAACIMDREMWGETIQGINSAPHEQIGALYILEHMSKNIEDIYDELIEVGYPSTRANDSILYAEYYKNKPIIDKTELDRDICFIVRMILGLKYAGYEPEKQIRNCFIELLNGSNFDVDKLDYVIRDTKMSGISNISVDVERLLGAVCIITKSRFLEREYQNKKFTNCVLLELNNDADSSLSIEGHFRGTILLKSGAEVTIFQDSNFVAFKTAEEGKIKYKAKADGARFNKETRIIQDSKEITHVIGRQEQKELPLNNGEPFECKIQNAKVITDFCFVVDEDPRVALELQINGYCKILIKGRFALKSQISCFDMTLNGQVHEIVLLDRSVKKEVPNEKTYDEFSVGFTKQAINLIANVLEARDYLYLWVYAHHKVIYYANFLIPVLSTEVVKQIKKNLCDIKKQIEDHKFDLDTMGNILFPMWELNYNNIQYLDDGYLWTAIKYYSYKNFGNNTEWSRLCNELLERNYKVSLYKSLAEYDLLFEPFSNSQKMNIKKYMREHFRRDMPYVGAETLTAGYLDESIISDLREKNTKLANVTNIIYVDASYTEKKIDTQETFIMMNKNQTIPVSEIPLLAERVSKSENTKQYFYLYYETSTEEEKRRKEEAVELKEAIKNYFLQMF